MLHENIKTYQNVCFPDDSHYKDFKNVYLSNMLIDDEIFKHCKKMPSLHLFCLHISDVINGDVIKTQ